MCDVTPIIKCKKCKSTSLKLIEVTYKNSHKFIIPYLRDKVVELYKCNDCDFNMIEKSFANGRDIHNHPVWTSSKYLSYFHINNAFENIAFYIIITIHLVIITALLVTGYWVYYD